MGGLQCEEMTMDGIWDGVSAVPQLSSVGQEATAAAA